MGRIACCQTDPTGKVEMNDDKRIPIRDKATGAIRYSEPFRQNVPSEPNPSTQVNRSNTPFGAELADTVQQIQPTRSDAIDVGAFSNKGASPKIKPKTEITTLEQFLIQAYALKGRRISVKKKVLQDISPNLYIPVERLVDLQKLVKDDKPFCVPRQILLAVSEIEGFPAIKEALKKFVMEVMLSHRIFKNDKLASAIRNLPDAPLPQTALKLVMEVALEKEAPEENAGDKNAGEKSARKAVNPEEIKINAVNCLVVWFAVSRHLSLEDVTEALNEAVWSPAGRTANSNITKLRALTEIEKAEGVGLACEMYKRRAIAYIEDAVRASTEVNGLRASLSDAQQLFEQTNSELRNTKHVLENLQKESAEEIATLHQTNETQAVHLRDDLEQQRSRVLRRLVAVVDMLDIGLSALQSPEPRIHVIRDRVEIVIDSLRIEIIKLREG